MIKIKFLGLIRLNLGIADMEVQASSIKEMLEEVAKKTNVITSKELKDYVIFVNGKNMVDLKMYRTKLFDGDEILIMSPVSGG